ncbi:hypothetical protein EJ110_NYTH23787 [Nymphaea thermarum]|nr:hypothetical protein EJ110_NYTH23787 [Nymphaea thermarum]
MPSLSPFLCCSNKLFFGISPARKTEQQPRTPRSPLLRSAIAVAFALVFSSSGISQIPFLVILELHSSSPAGKKVLPFDRNNFLNLLGWFIHLEKHVQLLFNLCCTVILEIVPTYSVWINTYTRHYVTL